MSKTNKSKASVKESAKRDRDRIPVTELIKPKKPKPTAKLSCLDAAATVLKAEAKPMTTKGMIEAMAAKKLWHSNAPTPSATLYSAILREMKTKGSKARFKKTDRGLFSFTG